MYDIELFKDESGEVRVLFQGKECSIKEFNLPLVVQLYKSVGQLPKFVLRDPTDPDLNYLSNSLAESIKKLMY